jgi:FAD/FMN-containing dehydrogenase
MRPALARYRSLRPARVASCASAQDVASAIAEAKAAGLPLAVRSGGHCFGGRSSTDGLVIDVSPLDTIEVGDGVVRVGAGAQLGAIYDALDAHDVTIAGGCGTTVGVSGLALGGGLGILGRTYGLLADSVRAAEVVLADGSVVEADGDLLWGLRGAGGARFGVVTALEIATVREPVMTAFETFWDDPAAAIAAWQTWAPDAPDALAASLLITVPPLQVKVFGAFAGPAAETRALVAALGRPAKAAFAEGTARDAKRFLAGLGGAEEQGAKPGSLLPSGGDDDGHAYLRSEFLAEPLSAAAIAALVAHLDEGSFHRELDFSPWGGAYNRVAPDATSFPHRGARCLLKHAAVIAPGEDPGPARAWIDRAWEITHPHGTGGAYVNFPEDGLDLWAPEYLGGNRERLLELKRRYDPEGVFG